MRSFTDEGIVLKRSNLGEADRLLTLFTHRHGKITVIAKGLRRPTSKRASSLELFNCVKFQAVQGRGELDILTEVELLDSFSSWRRHLGRVNLAYQLAEAVDKLTPLHQPHPQIFIAFKSHLFEIGKLRANWKSKIKSWLIEFASELGYWPPHQKFTGDVYEFLEHLTASPLHSPKLLSKLK